MPRRPDPFSLARSLVEPAWRKEEAQLYQHLPYGVRIGDALMTTRDGDVMGAIELRSVNPDTAAEADLEDHAEMIERILRFASDDIAIYVHRYSFPAAPAAPILAGDGFADAVDWRWTAHLNGARLFTRRTVLTAVSRAAGRLADRMGAGLGRKTEDDRERDIEALEGFFEDVAGAVGHDRVRRLTHGAGEWLGLCAALMTGRYHPIVAMSDLEPIAFLMPETPVFAKGARLRFPGEPDREAAVLSLKTYPPETTATVLNGLDLRAEMIVTQSYTPLSSTAMTERLRRRRGQMRSAGDDAMSLEAELRDLADDIASGRATVGEHHMSVAVFGTKRDVDDAAATIVSEIQRIGGSVRRERFGLRAIYFAQHPGNFAYRTTRTGVTSANFADMAGAHMRPAGLCADERVWAAPLTTLRTTSAERYAFDLHAARRGDGDLPPGHALILGPTGAGKSAFSAFLMAQAKRCGARLVVFDKDRGLECPLRALGADYIHVRPGAPTGLNPLAEAVNQAGVGWLSNWLVSLLSHGAPLSALQIEAVAEAARENAAAPDALRAFGHFAGHFGALADGGDLATRFREWTPEGRMGWMFDGRGADPFADAARDLAFDVTAVLDDPLMRLAWLGYIFRRIEARVEDGRPTIILMDEAWKLLDDGYFASVIKDWFVTMRKKNACVVMLTQLPEHVTASASGPSILQSVQTEVMFPNRDASPAALEAMGFNAQEVASLRTRRMGREALVRANGESVWCDVDLTALGPLLDILAGGGGERLTLAGDWRARPDFWKETFDDPPHSDPDLPRRPRGVRGLQAA